VYVGGKKIIKLTILLTLFLSGCASYPKYSVVQHSFAEGDSGFFADSKLKRSRVPRELAEGDGNWSRGHPSPADGQCLVYRENKDHICSIWGCDAQPDALLQYREDVDCAVWEATPGNGKRELGFTL